MHGKRSIAIISVKTTILNSPQKLNWTPGTPFPYLFVFSVGKKLLDQNDVEFDFRTGNVVRNVR